MFVREKTVNGYTYLYLVENVRENGRTKQRIIRNLGRKEAVLAAGDLDRLLASVGRFTERAMVLDAIDSNPAQVNARRIGGPLLFGRLWERLAIPDVLEDLLADRQFGFAVERAVFVA
ncbi:IS1634 family transposase, partial [Mesorhizobium sp. ArgA1]